MARLLLLALLLSTAACSDGIVGVWEEQNRPTGVTGELILEADQTGEYEIELEDSQSGAQGGVVYDVEWKEFSDKYELDFDCDELTGVLADAGTCADIATPDDFACELLESDILVCEYDSPEGGEVVVEFEREG